MRGCCQNRTPAQHTNGSLHVSRWLPQGLYMPTMPWTTVHKGTVSSTALALLSSITSDPAQSQHVARCCHPAIHPRVPASLLFLSMQTAVGERLAVGKWVANNKQQPKNHCCTCSGHQVQFFHATHLLQQRLILLAPNAWTHSSCERGLIEVHQASTGTSGLLAMPATLCASQPYQHHTS